MSRKEVLRVSHFSNSSCESLLIFCTTGSKVPGHLWQVALWNKDDPCLFVVQQLWKVPLHQNLDSLLVVMEGDDIPAPHVERVGVALGQMWQNNHPS